MPVPWRRTLLPQVLDDLRALAEVDEELADAALRAISDLAGRRRIGKALGARLVSGDMEGCCRLRFDLPGRRPERYRVVYRLRPSEDRPDTVEVISVGPRGGHAVYREAVARLEIRPGNGEGAREKTR
ncbi:MAG: type II toxin-antitoxin system RelE family toxin [Candidatus Dormibacteria bacterium]